MKKEEIMLRQIEVVLDYLELDLNNKSYYSTYNDEQYNNGYTHAIGKYYYIFKDMFTELKEIVNDINKQHEIIGKHFDELLNDRSTNNEQI